MTREEMARAWAERATALPAGEVPMTDAYLGYLAGYRAGLTRAAEIANEHCKNCASCGCDGWQICETICNERDRCEGKDGV